jgi:hypothetical protein
MLLVGAALALGGLIGLVRGVAVWAVLVAVSLVIEFERPVCSRQGPPPPW